MRSTFSVISLPLDCEQSLFCSKSVKKCDKINCASMRAAKPRAASCAAVIILTVQYLHRS